MVARHLCRWWSAAAILGAAAAVRGADPFENAPSPAESFEVGTLHVDRFGDAGKPVVLLPGLSCGAWEWYGTIEKFSLKYRIYVLTLPGFDGRAASGEKNLFTAFDRDFWKLLDEKKIEKPVVIGHSLGGTLAIGLGETHAEKLSGIVAVDGLPVFPMAAQVGAQQRSAMGQQMEKMFSSYSPEDFLGANKGFMAGIGTNKPELAEPAAKLESRSDPKAVGAWIRSDMDADLRPGLAKISVPLLEVMPYDPSDGQGPFGQTQDAAAAFYKSLLAGAPQARVETISPAKHFVMLDQPDKFYDVVGNFLEKAGSDVNQGGGK